MSKYALSRFTHFFFDGDVVACYHALRMSPIYISAKSYELLQNFSNTESDNIISLSEEEIDAMINAKILVQKSEDDEAVKYFSESLGKPYPHLVYFLLTEKCNFRCSYCFIKNQAELGYREGHMSSEVALKGLDFFCDLIQKDPNQFHLEKTIIFYGGEPLMNWQVFDVLLKRIREYQQIGKLPEKTVLNLVTNGSLITPSIAETLRDYNVQISISIDGDDFATNSSRVYADGNPVYQDVRRGFEICRGLGMDVGASCTLSEATISDFDKTMQILLDECNVTNLGLNLMISGNDKLIENYNQKAAQFIIDAFKVFREKGVYEDRIMRKASSFIEQRVWPFDCGATGGNQIVIAPSGDVGICHGFTAERKYFPTNVFCSEFEIESDPDYLEWNKRTPLNMHQCQNCPALGICGGGCPFQAHIQNGSIWSLDDRFCVHATKTLEWLIWDLYKQIKK